MFFRSEEAAKMQQ